MTEIIIAIILQLSTILGGAPADKEKSDNPSNSNGKEKTEKPVTSSGGTGNWDD